MVVYRGEIEMFINIYIVYLDIFGYVFIFK